MSYQTVEQGSACMWYPGNHHQSCHNPLYENSPYLMVLCTTTCIYTTTAPVHNGLVTFVFTFWAQKPKYYIALNVFHPLFVWVWTFVANCKGRRWGAENNVWTQRGKKEQESEWNCRMNGFVICTIYLILFEDQSTVIVRRVVIYYLIQLILQHVIWHKNLSG